MIPRSYSELVAFIEEDNSPPGAMDTIASWISDANIDSNSVVLDLACNTAYSSRSVVQLKSCRALGFDISKFVIAHAQGKVRRDKLAIDLLVANAESIPLRSGSVTHILAGSVFGFFERPEFCLNECARILQPKGYLCLANFYYVQRPPKRLLDSLKKAAGVRPQDSWTKEYWNCLFRNKFHLVTDHDLNLSIETPEAIAKTCHASVMALRELHDVSESDCTQALQQLYYYRLIFNEHRRYQRFAVQVWQN